MNNFNGARTWLLCKLLKRAEKTRVRRRVSGNVFFAVFAAVAMVGAIGYGFNSVLRGPISGMTEVTRRTVAESTVITASRLSIVGATTYQTAGGDCDNDGMIEPLAFAVPGTDVYPAGGGWLPRGAGPPAWALVPNSLDPWKTEYGYCAWDPGATQADPACGGTGRLIGSPNKNVQAFVIISAGKNKRFETSCADYNGATPNALLYNKPAGSDDIVLPYTYAEANDLGNGLWTPDTSTPATKTVADKNLEIKGTGTSSFSDVVQLTGAGGLILPGDPGDDSITGACNAANDRQLRRNMSDPANPAIEICDFTGSLGWNAISGGTGDATSAGLSGAKVAHWKFDETSGTTAFDSWYSHNGTLTNGPTWAPTSGRIGGALQFNSADSEFVRVPRSAYLEPTAVSGAVWVRRSGVQPLQATFLAKNVNNNAGPVRQSYWLGFNNAGNHRLNVNIGSGGTLTSFPVNYTVADNTWTHVIFTYDPSLSTQQLKVYINGVLHTTSNYSGAIEYDTTNAGNLYIGASDSSGQYPFNGYLDDARIYNYALSAAEIAELYNLSSPVLDTPSSSKSGPLYSWGKDDTGQLGNGTYYTADQQSAFATGVSGEFVQVSAGNDHACGIKTDSTVWCWGSDASGKLGNGPLITANQGTPTQVVNLTDAMKVSAGTNHTCALKHDGTVWCWGEGDYGALGGSGTTDSDIPKQITALSQIIDVSVGNGFSCSVASSGNIWCLGRGLEGQLGNGASANSSTPVTSSSVTDFVQVSANRDATSYSACGVTRRGKIYCWGTEQNGNFGNGGTSGLQNAPSESTPVLNFRKVELFGANACGLSGDRQLWCWGSDNNGQIGNGSTSSDQINPVLVDDGGSVADFSVGKNFVCSKKIDGMSWCWGVDTNGRLGNGTVLTTNQEVPSKVAGGKFRQISAGDGFVVAISGHDGKAGSVQLPRDKGKISAGQTLGCAIEQDGSLWCWGGDGTGQLGNGTVLTATQTSPSVVDNPGPWMQVAANDTTGSNHHACAIKSNGNLWCWGSNTSGKLGIGTSGGAPRESPVLSGTVDDYWSYVAVGGNSTCAIKTDGTLWCWGSNISGKLTGSGDRSSPTAISGGGTWRRVAIGENSTCAIQTTGALYCWGSDSTGQLGNGGTSLNSSVPVLVDQKGPWVDVAVGNENACAVKEDGTAWCWGGDHDLFPEQSAQSPQMIADPGPWISVDVSVTHHACGLKADGSAWCWGSGTDGVLGNGDTTASYIPVHVNGGNDWTAIDVGHALSCGMKKDRTAWCWGPDLNGKSGNGAGIQASSSPTHVHQYPKRAAWVWNNNDSYSPPVGSNPYLAPTKYISNDGAANTGLILGSGGGSAIRQPNQPNQLLLDTNGAVGSAQITMRAKDAVSFEDNIWGMTGRWKLDSSTGTTAVDDIGGANGALNNGPTWVPAGGRKAGSLLFTAASDQYVRSPRSGELETSIVTVSAWIKRNGAQETSACIVQKSHSNYSAPVYQSYGFEFNGTSDTQLLWSVGKSGGVNSLAMTSTIPNNTWTHIVGTYDPFAVTQNLRIYVNGALDATANYTDAIVYDGTSSGDLWMGGSTATPAAGFSNFNGEIDDVRIYGRALNETEVKLLYDSYISGNTLKRMFGQDPVGSFNIARNFTNEDVLLQHAPQIDLEIDTDGNVGLGTGGKPAAKLDVNGAIKIGNESTCTGAKAGTISYTGTAWRYCNASGSWSSFGRSSSLVGRAKVGGIEANENISCAILFNGGLRCWGEAAEGKLGNNQASTNSLISQTVHSDTSSSGWEDWVQVTALGQGVCGLRANGTVWCWGDASLGALGNNQTTTDALRPVQVHSDVSATGWSDWKYISGNLGTACGIRTDGSAWCWGDDNFGKMGNGADPSSSRPNLVQTDTGPGGWYDWRTIDVGGYKTCGIRTNGTAWCWGAAGTGQLGNNTTTPHQSRPVQVVDSAGTGNWSNWISICSGASHGCGVRTDGSAWCWGLNSDGRLGDNSLVNSPKPVQVRDSTGGASYWYDWKGITCGNISNCGWRANGTAWCWGAGGSGRLGNNSTAQSQYPVQVHSDSSATGWTDWVAISIKNNHTCGVRANGSLWCWGPGGLGQLGDNGTSNRLRPVRVQ